MTDRDTELAGSTGASAASWAPEACTLPSAGRPLRVAEFDALFGNSLRRVQRLAATRLLLTLDSQAEATARDLTARESECCSFFAFTVRPVGDKLHFEVEVPAAHVAVLDVLAVRAAAAAGGAAA
jgi:hypothetical protein